MASSENQGLTIALIVFLILTIILGVSTLLLFNQYKESSTRAEADRKKAQEADQAQRAAEIELEKLRELIGVGTSANLDEATAAFDEDMKNFAGTIPADKRFYRPALEFLSASLNQTNEQLVAAQDEIARLKESNRAFEEAKQKEVEQHQQAAQSAASDLATAQARFQDDLRKQLEANAEVVAQVEKKNQEIAQIQEQHRQQLETKDRMITDRDQEVASLVDRVKTLLGKGTVEYDGEIVRVNQQAGTVWINLGSADYLKPQTVFHVYTPGLPAAGERTAKGKIEVTRVIDGHLAEARIIEDKVSDLMARGDKVFTPLWSPGEQQRFAIAGRVDLGDGETQGRQQLRNLISLSGGVVDAEVDSEGNVSGVISPLTRYLVLGDRPALAAQPAFDAMVREAERLGVRVISVRTFLDQVGWRSNPRQLVQFGTRGNAGQIGGEQPDGGQRVSPGSVTDYFEKRRPPAASGAGAAGGRSAY